MKIYGVTIAGTSGAEEAVAVAVSALSFVKGFIYSFPVNALVEVAVFDSDTTGTVTAVQGQRNYAGVSAVAGSGVSGSLAQAGERAEK